MFIINAEIESRHDFFSQIYNHTVATILVEYASAVSSRTAA